MNTEATLSFTPGEPSLLPEFEILFARLQEYKEEGDGDSFQADGVRLRLDVLYDEMNEEERAAVRELTGRNLLAIDEEEEFEPTGFDEDAEALDEAEDDAADDDEEEAEYDDDEETEEVVAEVEVKAPPKRPPLVVPTKPVKVVQPVTRVEEVREVETQEEGASAEVAEILEASGATSDVVETDVPAVAEFTESRGHREPAEQVAAPIAADESAADAGPATHAPLPKPAEIFDRSVTFETLGLRSSLLKGIHAMGFEFPTDIQAKLIPVALTGKDAIGQARTGTGKTAAFGMPILHQADKDLPMQALILVPTRELAAQVAAEMEELGKFTPIRTTCIIGGESMRDQARSISKGGHIMVGTPGRVMDMQQRGEIHFNNIKFIVLDEVDRMLDIGFREDIRKILKSVHGDHQTLFVSATISEEIDRLARTFMKPDAEKIITISGSLTVSLVDQKYVAVEPWDKRTLLLHVLRKEKPEFTVVFCRTKATVDKLAKYLSDHGVDARPIHGDMPQNKRTKVMDSMRQGKLAVLIASDLAARGLDIDHITHVVNYDLPEDPEVYVHRIGRTARVGRRGFAWSFVTRDEGQRLTEIEMLCSTIIEKMEYPEFKPGPVPDDVRVSKPRVTHRPESATDLLAEKAAERTGPSPLEGFTPEQLKAMFPDGNIPKTLPKSTLGSKFRRKR